ncbi:MAG: RNA 2',3'-cyclic phosphodiesterase [Xanthobacteraceae bacterium]
MANSNTTAPSGSPTDELPSRIFVGVKVAPEIARELTRHVEGLGQSAVRLVPSADIHLTLLPPWDEVSIPEAIEKLRCVASRFGPFPLTFQHLGYGPQPKWPRLLWVECMATDEIAALNAALLRAFGQKDDRPFLPHVTLARIRGNGRAIARKNPIDLELSLTQSVELIELFRSPPPGGRGYQVLATFRLGETPHPRVE